MKKIIVSGIFVLLIFTSCELFETEMTLYSKHEMTFTNKTATAVNVIIPMEYIWTTGGDDIYSHNSYRLGPSDETTVVFNISQMRDVDSFHSFTNSNREYFAEYDDTYSEISHDVERANDFYGTLYLTDISDNDTLNAYRSINLDSLGYTIPQGRYVHIKFDISDSGGGPELIQIGMENQENPGVPENGIVLDLAAEETEEN